MEQHLFTCTACAATLEELRRVVERARALGPHPPERDLWPGIAERIGAAAGRGSATGEEKTLDLHARRASHRQRFAFSVPQLAAASLVLMLVSGGVVWLLRQVGPEPGAGNVAQSAAGTGQPARVAAADSTPTGGPAPGAVPVGFTENRYDAAVADLERALEQGRSRLAPETVRVLERNLQTIDGAIDEARRALAADPASVYLNEYLARTMRKKLDLLRQANALATART
jgi:hypothetical protein